MVDDASDDGTGELARAKGAQVVATRERRFAGGARNSGRAAARGDLIVYMDSDVVPAADWGAALARAASEFPGVIVGAARTFAPRTPWGWVAHLQNGTPFLPRGAARETSFVSSFCMAVPADVDVTWDESYGGEDAFFCADAVAAGRRIVFDPRLVAEHDHRRESFGALRSQQRRIAFGLARAAGAGILTGATALLVRFPIHYFLLLRLPAIYRRVSRDSALRARFVALLPRLVLAEWMLGVSAVRYTFRLPPTTS